MERIILAYSGGLETSVAVTWLAETYRAEVITVTMDLGQGCDLNPVRERALAAGAVRAHVLDVRAEFANHYILPALQAGAIDEGRHPLATALGRPVIASKLVEIARIEGATVIAHGCAGTGNDRERIDVSARALEPGITVIAPARVWGMTRPDQIEYARQRNIPVPATPVIPYRTDANLWGRSINCGALEDPWAELPADVGTLTVDPAECPDQPAYVEIDFERGVPVSVNGISMTFLDIIGSLGTIAGNHGVGRIDMVETRFDGITSREIYESPAAVVLFQAHTELEGLVIPRDLDRVKRDLGFTYADLIDSGQWHSPVREAIDAFVAATQERVTGTIRVKFLKGASRVVGRRARSARGDHALAARDEGDRFDHRAADGFIAISGRPLETTARRGTQATEPARTTEAA